MGDVRCAGRGSSFRPDTIWVSEFQAIALTITVAVELTQLSSPRAINSVEVDTKRIAGTATAASKVANTGPGDAIAEDVGTVGDLGLVRLQGKRLGDQEHGNDEYLGHV